VTALLRKAVCPSLSSPLSLFQSDRDVLQPSKDLFTRIRQGCQHKLRLGPFSLGAPDFA
jgi:hypothetical protein